MVAHLSSYRICGGGLIPPPPKADSLNPQSGDKSTIITRVSQGELQNENQKNHGKG